MDPPGGGEALGDGAGEAGVDESMTAGAADAVDVVAGPFEAPGDAADVQAVIAKTIAAGSAIRIQPIFILVALPVGCQHGRGGGHASSDVQGSRLILGRR